MMLKPGQTVAHFEIVRQLGAGGMGEVYLAEDKKLARQVALKTVAEGVFEDAERLERFHREARTAARISHPNVMAIYDIGSVRDVTTGRDVNYIVMEYVKGRPLGEYLDVNKPELPKVVRLAEKIAAGLAAAHQMNIVHRDIKMDNILVDEGGKPKILDFGLAKPVEPLQMEGAGEKEQTISQELTKAGKILGTVKYMSPEQVQGKPVDHRSDVFSFGILLYSMCTGESPFAGRTQVSTMAKILEVRHESPRAANEDFPVELERIIDKCLSKDPDDRYQDTRDLVVDLRNLRRQYDSGVTGAISVVTDRELARQRSAGTRPWWGRAIVWAPIVIVTVALLSMLVWFFRESGPGTAAAGQSSLAILGFENKTGDAELDWLETGLPEILLTDLSRSPNLRIIGRQRILESFPADKQTSYTFEDCVQAARSLGADELLSGSFFKLGELIRIDARLEDVGTGRIILGEKVIGPDPFVLVDSLTAKISAQLNLTRADTTRPFALSPDAFKQYHLGMELFRSGLFDEAVAKFNEALAIDSTFALPYMRIAQVHVSQGHLAEAARYLRLAKSFEQKLPLSERSLLDVYADMWLNINYDHAFAKLKSMLRDYPQDAEVRTLYAVLVNAFQRDTVTAFAHLDTVLMTYPTSRSALGRYAEMYEEYGDYGKAIEYTQRLLAVIPDSPFPQLRLVELYSRQGRQEEAAAICEGLLSRFPSDPRPVRLLRRLSILRRDFATSRRYVELLRQQNPDDPYLLAEYYGHLANLSDWGGRFSQAMSYRLAALDHCIATADSMLVFSVLNDIANAFRHYGMPDSALGYSARAFEWAVPYNQFSYAIDLVVADTANAARARPISRKALDDLRARVPRDIWSQAEQVDVIFEGFARADTPAVIDALRLLIEEQAQEASDNVRELGVLLVKSGRYEEGRRVLEPFLSGEYESSSGWTYPYSLYLVGLASEELGDTGRAVECYREMLTYWGNPEIELEEIRDARERLNRLTS
ncbi:MAG TPA: protein kinase [Acidobacteriota bacterium]|nr:protein kinase [Acidobacteriota bacterium]